MVLRPPDELAIILRQETYQMVLLRPIEFGAVWLGIEGNGLIAHGFLLTIRRIAGVDTKQRSSNS
jgi:hypothetical protein